MCCLLNAVVGFALSGFNNLRQVLLSAQVS